jgi:hypothetical protein
MSTKHKIVAEQSLYACEVPLLTFQAEITFTWQPESGDGWNEPRTGEFAEFDGVTQLSGPEIADADLAEWAWEWLSLNHAATHQQVYGDRSEWAVRRAEQCADMARTDRASDEEPF